MRMATSRVIAVAILTLTAAAVPTFADKGCMDDSILQLPDPCEDDETGDDDGSSSPATEDNTEFVEVVKGVNVTNATQVKNATLTIRDKAKTNLTEIRDALVATTNISQLVHATHEQRFPNHPGWEGRRTNTSGTLDQTDLADSSIALHEEVGEPLSDTEQVTLKTEAAEVPDAVAAAGATLNYATIDALHYTNAALENVNATQARIVSENRTFLSMYQRVIELEHTDTGPNLTVNEVQETVLEAAANVSKHVDMTDLFRAADVLGEAIDEIQSEYNPADLTVSDDIKEQSDCTQDGEQTTIFDSKVGNTVPCVVVIGGSDDHEYAQMRGEDGIDNNWVLVDIGGNDTYHHRAGGGYNTPPEIDTSNRNIGITGRVQVNADFDPSSAGKDIYRGNTFRSPCTCGIPGGAYHGSGSLGLGVLFDEAGNDQYMGEIVSGDQGVPARGIGQGSGFLGYGMLIDQGGSDTYSSFKVEPEGTLNAQGFGGIGGVGTISDEDGDDDYSFHLKSRTNPSVNEGGAQGAATGGAGYLLDFGTGGDDYTAGQGLVQGAAAWGGWAYLLDEGSSEKTNNFTLRATTGCPQFEILPGVQDPDLSDTIEPGDCETDQAPVGSWGQGYAITGGFAGFLAGSGNDTHTYSIVPDTTETTWVARNMLASGNTTGSALVVDRGGNDIYNATQKALGHGNRGLGVFVNAGSSGTLDEYNCAVETCYGYGHNLTTNLTDIKENLDIGAGLGAFYDGANDDDSFATDRHPGTRSPDDPNDRIWTKNDLGIGVDQ